MIMVNISIFVTSSMSMLAFRSSPAVQASLQGRDAWYSWPSKDNVIYCDLLFSLNYQAKHFLLQTGWKKGTICPFYVAVSFTSPSQDNRKWAWLLQLQEDDNALFSFFFFFFFLLLPFGVLVKNHTYVCANGVGFALLSSGEEKPSGIVFVLSKVQWFSSLSFTPAPGIT